MKQKIQIINKEGVLVYKGHILDIPIKDDYIIKKSIELFDDDDPCIIHKSFVIKKFVEEMLQLFKDEKTVKLVNFKDQLTFLAIHIDDCTMIIGG